MRWLMSLVAFLSLLASCTVESRIQVFSSGEALATTRIVLQPAFVAYWRDLRGADSTLPASLVDTGVWKKALSQQVALSPPRLTQTSVKGGAGEVTLTFGIPDINSALGSQSLGRVSTANGKTQLLLTLDRKRLRTLFSLTTVGNSTAVPQLIPADNAKVSANDYAQLLSYLLEPYDAKAATLVAQCQVELTLELPSVPTLVEGAATVSGTTVRARWPLARVLSLETPITLRAVY